MASKKDFKKTPAEMFISTAAEPQEEPKAPAPARATEPPQQEALIIPKGFRLAPEHKSQRVQLLVKPSTKEVIKGLAEDQGISMNELINNILEEYAERKGK